MGGIKFGWLTVWVLSPDWLSRELDVCDFCQALRWSRRAWVRGVRAVPRLCIVYPAFAFNWWKITETPQSEYPKGARLTSAQRHLFSRIGHRERCSRLACCPLPPLAFASGDGSTLGQRKYLPSCRTRGFPTSAKSKLAFGALMWSAWRDKIYGPCKTRNLGALACRGGHQSRRYRRHSPRRGKLRRLASLRRSSWLFVQRDGPAARTCYAWVQP